MRSLCDLCVFLSRTVLYRMERGREEGALSFGDLLEGKV